MVATGWPVLVSLSHKDFVGETLDAPLEERLIGTLAATAVSAWHGARVYRVHDVAETRQTLDMVAASAAPGPRPGPSGGWRDLRRRALPAPAAAAARAGRRGRPGGRPPGGRRRGGPLRDVRAPPAWSWWAGTTTPAAGTPVSPVDVRRFGTTAAPARRDPPCRRPWASARGCSRDAGWARTGRARRASPWDARRPERRRPRRRPAPGDRTAPCCWCSGDGSTRRGDKAPGYLDERAFGVRRRRRARPSPTAMRDALRDLDAGLAEELMVLGSAAFRVLGAGRRCGRAARPARR